MRNVAALSSVESTMLILCNLSDHRLSLLCSAITDFMMG